MKYDDTKYWINQGKQWWTLKRSKEKKLHLLKPSFSINWCSKSCSYVLPCITVTHATILPVTAEEDTIIHANAGKVKCVKTDTFFYFYLPLKDKTLQLIMNRRVKWLQDTKGKKTTFIDFTDILWNCCLWPNYELLRDRSGYHGNKHPHISLSGS